MGQLLDKAPPPLRVVALESCDPPFLKAGQWSGGFNRQGFEDELDAAIRQVYSSFKFFNR
jgi:hypothetical protein